ncbi:MAG TPA: right-handed parallel beta-helix repeat-containing protein [Rhizomicrobium sp.]|jgi:hypothetical protein
MTAFKYLLAITFACLLLPTAAQAQATRTWISGVGDDVNPCSRTAPCKTFAGAISKTAAGGEIDTLDPGGFGGVTVTKAMTLADEGVGEAGILVAGTNGVTVNCVDPSCVVVIRGLVLDGGPVGSNSLNGVRFIAGKALEIENCAIRNFTGGSPNGYGVQFQPNGPAQLDISDTTITTNGQQGGGSGIGGGVLVQPQAGGSAKVTITRVNLHNNSNGIRVDNTTAAAVSTVAIRDTTISASSTHGLAAVNPSSGTPFKNTITADRMTISGNAGDGVVANGVSTIINLSNSVITGNVFGVNVSNGGAINSYKNNVINGNTNDNTAVLSTSSTF